MKIERIIINNKTKDLSDVHLFKVLLYAMYSEGGIKEFENSEGIKNITVTLNDKYKIAYMKTKKGTMSFTIDYSNINNNE